MPWKPGKATVWLALIAIAAMSFAMVAIPVWLIQPFAAQTERNLEISFLLRSWSPVVTVVLAVAAVVLAVMVWRRSTRWFAKAFVIAPLSIIFIFTWLARQNHFEWMFNPLVQSSFAAVSQTDFVADDDMVLAVAINGDAVAFPVRQMGYHHVVQDVVGGTPITATY